MLGQEWIIPHDVIISQENYESNFPDRRPTILLNAVLELHSSK